MDCKKIVAVIVFEIDSILLLHYFN